MNILGIQGSSVYQNNTKVKDNIYAGTQKPDSKKTIDERDFLNTRNYHLAFLGKKNYTKNEKEFLALRKALARELHQDSAESAKRNWNMYTGQEEASSDIKQDTRKKHYKPLWTYETCDKLKKIQAKGINDPTLKIHLNKLIGWMSGHNSEPVSINQKELYISKKINAYRGKVNGQEYSNADLNTMLSSEKNVEKRKEIYTALEGGGDVIARDLVELVKQRNSFARQQGYPNYFSYKLKNSYGVNENELFTLLNDLEAKTDKIAKKMYKENDEKLARAYNIKPEDLRPWHYGLLLEDSPIKEANKYIKDREDLLPITKAMYKKMGWDLDKLPITYDIFPRQGKNQHGFCFDIDTSKDIRILANLTNNLNSLETLNHETGHAIYDAGISDRIPYLDRNVASSALTEAVAMLMENLPIREKKFFQDKLNMPDELVERLSQQRKKGQVGFVRHYLKLLNFEREMYRNPDQDLAKLWFDTDKKYRGRNIPEKLNNEWASVPHFLSHPAYLQNYLRAEMMASQIHDSFKNKYGTDMLDTEKTHDFFEKKMFRRGSYLSENEMMKKLTGSKLMPDAFVNELESLTEKTPDEKVINLHQYKKLAS
ncbi:MAG: hypothetical protein ACD_20C00090G0020 [uncultured bacterium]|nr:MAG: hypothetical protein ACD_20C00090G0020 [uncultured bacterium]HBH17850.1 hypothetical protein [Cyanobacteria bacterium UBA9579]